MADGTETVDPTATSGTTSGSSPVVGVEKDLEGLRREMVRRYVEDTTRAATNKDDLARRLARAQQGATTAAEQVRLEEDLLTTRREQVVRYTADAAKARAEGREADAREMEEQAEGADAVVRVTEARLDQARTALTTAMTEQADLTQRAAQAAADLRTVQHRWRDAEVELDKLEDRQEHLDQVARHTTEADRLAGEANRMRSEGKTAGAITIEEAALHERRLAQQAQEKADEIRVDERLLAPLTDPTWVDETLIDLFDADAGGGAVPPAATDPTPVETDPVDPDPVNPDPVNPDVEPTPAQEPEPTPAETPAGTDEGIDPNLIEIEDPLAPAEATHPTTGDPTASDPLSGDVGGTGLDQEQPLAGEPEPAPVESDPVGLDGTE